jgi:hypothetical protein
MVFNATFSNISIISSIQAVESGVKHHNPNPRLDWRYNWNIVESGVKHHNPNPRLDW